MNGYGLARLGMHHGELQSRVTGEYLRLDWRLRQGWTCGDYWDEGLLQAKMAAPSRARVRRCVRCMTGPAFACSANSGLALVRGAG